MLNDILNLYTQEARCKYKTYALRLYLKTLFLPTTSVYYAHFMVYHLNGQESVVLLSKTKQKLTFA